MTVSATVFMTVVILVAIQTDKSFIPGYLLGAAISVNLLLGFTFGTILQIKVYKIQLSLIRSIKNS